VSSEQGGMSNFNSSVNLVSCQCPWEKKSKKPAGADRTMARDADPRKEREGDCERCVACFQHAVLEEETFVTGHAGGLDWARGRGSRGTTLLGD
jgi:hypothetical protein